MNEQIRHYEDKLRFEIDSADLAEDFAAGKVTIVDARKAEFFDQEHIPGAVNLPHRLMNEDSTRSWDRSRVYVAYCDGIGCNASTQGALKLARLGFTVKELIGGLDWWKRDGHPTEGTAGTKPAGAVSCAC